MRCQNVNRSGVRAIDLLSACTNDLRVLEVLEPLVLEAHFGDDAAFDDQSVPEHFDAADAGGLTLNQRLLVEELPVQGRGAMVSDMLETNSATDMGAAAQRAFSRTICSPRWNFISCGDTGRSCPETQHQEPDISARPPTT